MFVSPGLIYHDECEDGDPLVKMRTIRVLFSNKRYNYQTQINGTRKEIAEYFRGANLDVGNGNRAIPNRIEFISVEEDGQTVAIELN